MRMPEESSRALIPSASDSDGSGLEDNVVRKLDRRLLTLCVAVALLAYMDRSNLGYAANDLCTDLEFTHGEYGFGVGLFYAGYLSSQIVGNMLLGILGAPVWVSFLTLAWGCVAACTAAIQNVAQFYVLRVLLGVAEGGIFPALFYLTTLFYPSRHVPGVHQIIAAAGALSMPVSAPVSAGLVSLGPHIGMDGWRLLFLVEGLVPVVCAVGLYFLLPGSPENASFLTSEEKRWVASELEREAAPRNDTYWEDVKVAFSSKSWIVATAATAISFGVNSVLLFWATLLIQEALYGEDDDDESCGTEHGNSALSILTTAIPYTIIVATIAALKRRTGINRCLFCTLSQGITGITLIAFAHSLNVSRALSLALLFLCIIVGYLTQAFLAPLAMSFLHPSVRLSGFALTNTLASLGALGIPLANGVLIDRFGKAAAASVSGGLLLPGVTLTYTLKDPPLRNKDEGDSRT